MQDREHLIFNLLLVMTFLYANEVFGFIDVGIMEFAVAFAGVLAGTMFLSPDLDSDSRSYKRWGAFSFFWLPYKWAFKHGQSSHGIVTGFLSRVLYFSVVVVVVLAAVKLKYGLPFDPRSVLYVLMNNLRVLTLFLIGVFLSNLGHVFGDKITKG